jgi:AraC family transcriptional regulator, exoenzyme S synthesis regulatory protein ExsA
MVNIYDYISNTKYFKTFKVNDLLIVEYKCMISSEKVPFWTHSNYFSYILSGETKYTTNSAEYIVQPGNALFLKKGTYVAQRHGFDDYCALLVFVSDDFIKKVAEKHLTSSAKSNAKVLNEKTDGIFQLALDDSLSAYFQSLLTYFKRETAPPDDLLKVKAEELLLNILTGPGNPSLAACLQSIRDCGKVSLRDVMETSFMYPMSLEQYAKLCARSLSTFKTDFYSTYKMTPGKWLIKARLGYAKMLLQTTDDSINDVAFKSGFKNTAHFVTSFKEAYGMPPLQYRLSKAA